jgi:hypothetical protein
MNHYEILEVSQNASPEVLKAAYKSLIQRFHPDRNPGDQAAAERSRSVVEAYQILSDPAKRVAYDIELKRQLENQGKLRDRMHVLAVASASETKRDSHWISWSVIALIAASLWFVWPASKKEPQVDSAPKKDGSLQAGHLPKTTPLGGSSLAARTVPNYIENLKVSLNAAVQTTGAASTDSAPALSISSISVVVGDFDSDQFVVFLENNRNYIGRKLAEKLAGADYEMLVKNDGDRYLKTFILDSIGEITNTNRREKYSLLGTETAAHYGAVNVVLPDSFTVTVQKSSDVMVRRSTSE